MRSNTTDDFRYADPVQRRAAIGRPSTNVWNDDLVDDIIDAFAPAPRIPFKLRTPAETVRDAWLSVGAHLRQAMDAAGTRQRDLKR